MKPILYAEDDDDDVLLLRRAFKEVGVPNPLTVVQDGIQAIEYLSGKGAFADRDAYPTPCLAILDINMAGMSGLEVLKWVRAHPNVCGLPIIMLTSSSQDSDVHRASILGANGFLVKPGSHKDLIVMVRSIQDYWLGQNRSVLSAPTT